MKRAMVVLAVVAGVMGQKGQAWPTVPEGTDTISVTVSLAEIISVSVTPDSWAIGPIALGGVSEPKSFTASVGNVNTKLEIESTDAAGGWKIGPVTGADQFAATVTTPPLSLSTAYQQLAASVAKYSSQGFDLTYHAPTSDTKGGGVDQSFTVTLKASEATP